MSNLPSIPTGGASGSIGPDGISFSMNLTLDRCNARPVFFYVVQNEGRIWRLVDPLSPTEQIPVWKEWSEEKEVPQGHWEEVPCTPAKPPELPPPPPGAADTVEVVAVDEGSPEEEVATDDTETTPEAGLKPAEADESPAQ